MSGNITDSHRNVISTHQQLQTDLQEMIEETKKDRSKFTEEVKRFEEDIQELKR
jgi:hypothetical protein